ncbi:UNVERIFIED_CONTAM: hypothetical protein Scaly_2201300 [Sesamum calycinum]|uniref:Retrotransposon gag domain-containing protein n=1 Tax=Sesamum calycinum TaxID=2727403 RepID=A0AAW2MQ82_9LAMI
MKDLNLKTKESSRKILENTSLSSRATTIHKEISGIFQFIGESLFEYWERFNELVKSCLLHQIPDYLLIQYFYEGLSSIDRKLIDAARGGALFNKTPTEARNLISIMVSNTQQFGTRYDDPPRKSNEGDFSDNSKGDMTHSPTPIPQMEGSPELELWCTTTKLSKIPIQTTCVTTPIQYQSSGKALQENTEENVTKRGHAQKRKPEKRFTKSKKEEEEKEIFEIFPKVEVNIPLLDAIKQIPPMQSFSKNYVPAKVSSKGTNGIKRAMCDLEASINVMPLTIFESLHVGPLKETGVVIQLADRSVVYPEGVLADVLV